MVEITPLALILVYLFTLLLDCINGQTSTCTQKPTTILQYVNLTSPTIAPSGPFDVSTASMYSLSGHFHWTPSNSPVNPFDILLSLSDGGSEYTAITYRSLEYDISLWPETTPTQTRVYPRHLRQGMEVSLPPPSQEILLPLPALWTMLTLGSLVSRRGGHTGWRQHAGRSLTPGRCWQRGTDSHPSRHPPLHADCPDEEDPPSWQSLLVSD